MPDGLIVEYLFVSKNEYNAGLNQKIVDFSPAGVFQFPLTTDYKSLSDKVSVKNVGLTKYYTYSKCKGLKNSENATFVVNNIHSDNTLEIKNVTLDLNKLIYTFTDKLNKVTGEFSRSFSSSNQEVTNNFKTTLLNNKDSIDPIKNNGLNEEFNIITLDCETYFDHSKTQKLLSVAIYDGKSSKFYFIGNYKSEFELIRDLLLDLLNYNNFNIYIHNGIRFDLVFLFKHFIKVAKESKFNVDVVYKDGEILNLSIRNKKKYHTI